MTRRRWWWIGFLMIGEPWSVLGDDHDHEPHDNAGCFLLSEVEPNATVLTAQFLGDLFVADCAAVAGSLLIQPMWIVTRVFVQEPLTLIVTIDHSPFVDFDVQLFDADTGVLISLIVGINVVPERRVVPFVVRGFDIAVDVVVTSFIGGRHVHADARRAIKGIYT